MNPTSENSIVPRLLTEDEKFLLQESRSKWERKYQKKSGDDFAWHLQHPPEILVKLLETGEVPKGPAVDLGCGAVVSTSYIAEHSFRPTIGLDIAFSAVCQARKFCDERGTSPSFVVAAVPPLPFKKGELYFSFRPGLFADASENNAVILFAGSCSDTEAWRRIPTLGERFILI